MLWRCKPAQIIYSPPNSPPDPPHRLIGPISHPRPLLLLLLLLLLEQSCLRPTGSVWRPLDLQTTSSAASSNSTHIHSRRRGVNGTAVVLQWYCSGATVELQWSYSGATVVLQWSYSGATVGLQVYTNHTVLLQIRSHSVVIDRSGIRLMRQTDSTKAQHNQGANLQYANTILALHFLLSEGISSTDNSSKRYLLSWLRICQLVNLSSMRQIDTKYLKFNWCDHGSCCLKCTVV